MMKLEKKNFGPYFLRRRVDMFGKKENVPLFIEKRVFEEGNFFFFLKNENVYITKDRKLIC